MSVNVPSQYRGYVQNAAKTLGIPEQVVAAQIQLESNFNPRAVSGAGAQGIAQFMPATFAAYGPKGGSPYNVKDAFTAYVAYMKYLLKLEKGSVRRALQAYNAGPGNLKAGAHYADTILTRAGASESATASGGTPTGSSSSGGGGLLDWPGDIVDFFRDATNTVTSTVDFFTAFFKPSTYIRIGAGLGGFLFIILGIIALGMSAAKD